jgi:hypothetical protein
VGKLLFEAGDFVAQARSGLIVFDGDGLLHLPTGVVKATAELAGRQSARRSATDMGSLVLYLEEQTAEGVTERLPTGRTTEASALAEINVREAALRAGERRNGGSGRQGVGQLEDGRIGRPALLGAGLTKMHLRDITMDDLGKVDRGGLLAERTLDRL